MRRFAKEWERRCAASRVQIEHLQNELSVNMTHSSHLDHLYLFLCDAVEAQREKDSEDPLFAEFQAPFLQWHKDEALKVGVISVYHFWERRVRSFLAGQFARLKCVLPKEAGDFVSFARARIERDLGAELDDDLWSSLDEARQVSNAVKHGDTAAFAILRSRFPHYFPADRGSGRIDPADSFCVQRTDFERLSSSFREFWEFMPHKLSIR